ncbi:MAG TPA: 50S ribosomal protein L25/general stress protein Ctc [Patescibacteria group bacterium]|nr:50S ribosomal protein L25/general stress protein Ctc [Patescibacteria group bacterium]
MTQVTNFGAVVRVAGGKGPARETRRQGFVPGVIYGNKQAPVSISLNPRRLWAEMNTAGFVTRLFNVQVDGVNELCLCRDVQRHPVTGQPLHVDFLRVTADSKVHVKVPVHFANQDKSPGIKAGGVLNVVHHELEIIVAADHIPSQLVVDLTGLEIGTSLHLSAVPLPEGATAVSHEKGMTIATIAAPTVAPGGTEGASA